MDRYALINDKTDDVENVILWDGEADYVIPPGYSMQLLKDDSPVDTTYTYINGEFVQKPEVLDSDIKVWVPSAVQIDSKSDIITSLLKGYASQADADAEQNVLKVKEIELDPKEHPQEVKDALILLKTTVSDAVK